MPTHGQALDQFGLSCGREERLSLNETLSFREPGRHMNDETALDEGGISGQSDGFS